MLTMSLIVSDSFLILRFANDYNGSGRLSATARANGFAGEGEAYFDIEALREFGRALDMFPLPDRELSIQGGAWSRFKAGVLEQEEVGISEIGRAHV